MDETIPQRKADHLDLCATGDVGFRHKTTLLEQVELVHEAVPELALAEVDTTVELLGKPLRAPLLIAGMTGGTERAKAINRDLAAVAEERGYGFGLGSQRAMLETGLDLGYGVREVAPSCLLLGNLGATQARELSSAEVAELADRVGADGLCIHLNAAMEIIQPEGDRDFSGILDAVGRLARELGMPLLVKETGCGISWRTAKRLADAGIRHVDVSGAGGTSWVAVETERASGEPGRASLGRALREWGVPTAASVAYARRTRPAFQTIIASGGVETGLDVARAIALGAHAAAAARAVLRAWHQGGVNAVHALFDAVEAELRAVMLLAGAENIAALRKVPIIAGDALERWLAAAPRP